eukprot:370750_1
MGNIHEKFGKKSKSKGTKEKPKESMSQQADSMQMVLPNVYMGSAETAKNSKLLKSVGITHVLAVGWNLKKYHENDFKYLLINEIEDRPGFFIMSIMKQCFKFMDECIVTNKSNLFVHCHKGLSRSATTIIAYEMYAHKKPYEKVLAEIRKNRSFIMPNIGFQAQLAKFEQTKYSLDFDKDWTDFNVLHEIKKIIPPIKQAVMSYYKMYESGATDDINDKDLFAKTMYIHQVHKLRERNKLAPDDINQLNEAINYLRKIQVEFICDETSINRFNIMFKHEKKTIIKSDNVITKVDTNEIKESKQVVNEIDEKKCEKQENNNINNEEDNNDKNDNKEENNNDEENNNNDDNNDQENNNITVETE